MKNYKHVYLLAVVLLSAEIGAQAQTPTDASAGAPAQVRPVSANGGSTTKLDSSTSLVAEFTQSLNSKNAKPGATVKAKVIQDVIAHGKVIVRRDSKLIGHVTEAQASSKDAPGARLGVVFDKVSLKGGGELDFHGLIEAMAPPLPAPLVELDQMGPPPMGGGTPSSGPQPIAPNGTTKSNGSGASSAGMQRPSVAGITGPSTFEGTPRHDSLSPAGALSSGAHGVFGMPGIRLMHRPSGGSNASVVVSVRDNVSIDSGTQIVIQPE
jgi:hypothetical protein